MSESLSLRGILEDILKSLGWKGSAKIDMSASGGRIIPYKPGSPVNVHLKIKEGECRDEKFDGKEYRVCDVYSSAIITTKTDYIEKNFSFRVIDQKVVDAEKKKAYAIASTHCKLLMKEDPDVFMCIPYVYNLGWGAGYRGKFIAARKKDVEPLVEFLNSIARMSLHEEKEGRISSLI
ncbi:hypothetical protein [Candidatus Methanodesulfokora washburnensis]|uniref:Uncharacterized protein n=1 Tax=Candidatus Methanodesulfokora washburnensis TaxID=2478471 RepID=A0A3R9PC85_9CREN|nr:hypothetical protein [Candidatus Methanodesulfokores washburnensis]RSN72370.1 hypothetical protein D6D85_14135 [Candidatus Methanodesulfokores washburnensis]